MDKCQDNCIPAKAAPQIGTQLEITQGTLLHLEENITNLETQLKSILREKESPEKDPSEKVTDVSSNEVLVPLAEQLFYNRDRIHRVNVILNSLLDRLEI